MRAGDGDGWSSRLRCLTSHNPAKGQVSAPTSSRPPAKASGDRSATAVAAVASARASASASVPEMRLCCRSRPCAAARRAASSAALSLLNLPLPANQDRNASIGTCRKHKLTCGLRHFSFSQEGHDLWVAELVRPGKQDVQARPAAEETNAPKNMPSVSARSSSRASLSEPTAASSASNSCRWPAYSSPGDTSALPPPEASSPSHAWKHFTAEAAARSPPAQEGISGAVGEAGRLNFRS